MNNKLKFSAVVVTYNRIKLLKECINHILAQTYPVFEIIIVNNNSQDETKEFLKTCSKTFEMVKIINLSHNLGGAGGYYEGIKNVSPDTDYLLLMDDDAILNKNYLEEISNQLENKIYAYSGIVLTNNKIDTSHRRNLSNDVLMKTNNVSEEEYSKDIFYYDIASFCGLVIANSLIKKIGLPKKEYFIWNDDMEYSLRIIKHTSIKNVNNAILNHKTILEEKGKITWKNFYGYRNKIDLGREHSKNNAIFLFYKYIFHFIQMIRYGIKVIIHFKNRRYYKNCLALHMQVILDSFQHKLGISEKFYPGRDLNK